MRKELQREVTHTVVKSVKVVVENGVPVIQDNQDLTLIGNVNEDKALKLAVKEFGQGTQVVSVQPDTKKYTMSLETFLKHATEIEPDPEETF